MMTLYSWFSRIKKGSNKKNIRSEQSKANQSVQYIENYTMWPTATIKSDAKVIPQSYTNTDEGPLQPQQPIINIVR
jgi:hypothetical protein